MKLLNCFIVSFLVLFTSCSITYNGQLTQNGKAIKVALEGGRNQPSIFLNDEFIGKLKPIEKEFMKKYTYEKVQTKFGVLQVILKIKWTLTDNKEVYDFYIDEEYTGSVTVEYGGLGQGPK
jgi:hypothetical protein